MEFTLKLDAASKSPLYRQIYRHVVSEIRAGRLSEGAKLPSKRDLCAHLAVSLSTVEAAYGALVAEGYVRSAPRSGYFVLPMTPLDLDKPRARPVLPAEEAPAAPAADPFSTSAVDTRAFPYATWAKLFKETIYARPELLKMGERQGDEELRRALAEFLYQYRGVNCVPGQLVIGAGLEYLLGVLMQLLPAGAVALEDPGYAASYRSIALSGREVLPIPVDEKGMNVDLLSETRARVAYVTPSHQFPTGVSMPFGRRTQLLGWAARDGHYVIEDDYDSEFRYSSRPIPALQGLSDGGNVVYVGTFSRSIAPSIRIAYMALPDSLLRVYRVSDAGASPTVSRFEQQTLARFLSGGYFSRHLRRVGTLYRRRCRRLAGLLETLPGAHVQGDDAGLHFLVRHDFLSERDLIARARSAGIPLRGLSEFCVACPPPPATVVMGFAGLDDAWMDQSVEALRRAWSPESSSPRP